MNFEGGTDLVRMQIGLCETVLPHKKPLISRDSQSPGRTQRVTWEAYNIDDFAGPGFRVASPQGPHQPGSHLR
jgi:hypothetical protein